MASSLEKIYRGAYHYLQGEEQFTTEIFEIFQLENASGYILKSETLTRIKSGDFLKLLVTYQINNRFVPIEVTLEKYLGMLKVIETFKTNPKEQKIDYTFVRGANKVQLEIPAPGNFQISTPSAAFSLICVKARKPDFNVRNRYMTVKSDNAWDYHEPPTAEQLYIEVPTNPSMMIYMGEKELNANVYNLYASEDTGTKTKDDKPVVYYLSDHLGIPYKILDSSGLRIEVKNLNFLQKNKTML